MKTFHIIESENQYVVLCVYEHNDVVVSRKVFQSKNLNDATQFLNEEGEGGAGGVPANSVSGGNVFGPGKSFDPLLFGKVFRRRKLKKQFST